MEDHSVPKNKLHIDELGSRRKIRRLKLRRALTPEPSASAMWATARGEEQGSDF